MDDTELLNWLEKHPTYEISHSSPREKGKNWLVLAPRGHWTSLEWEVQGAHPDLRKAIETAMKASLK